MKKKSLTPCWLTAIFFVLIFWVAVEEAGGQTPPSVPVKVAEVQKKNVSEQIVLIGTAEPILSSTVASEAEGLVDHFPVKEGDFVKKGSLLVRLKAKELELRRKAAVAAREKIGVNIENARKELARISKLKDTDAVAQKRFDEADSTYRALVQDLSRSEAEIELLDYDIRQQEIFAPFSGFIVKEHTQIGEWMRIGNPVVTLIDLQTVLITVPVPERYLVQLASKNDALVTVRSVSNLPVLGKIYSILSQGDPNSRTFSVKVSIDNINYRIKSGMEAIVVFNLAGMKEAMLVPKDAVVNAGRERFVYKINDGKAYPATVEILGYYDGNAAVNGDLKPGDQVVIRGNERLRPGQQVQVQ